MKIDDRSIVYALIANGVQIYFSDDDYFIASKLICVECGYPWYMNLTECFLCGEINKFLYRCSDCFTFQSITKSNMKCKECGSSNLYMMCSNPDCLSNKDIEIKNRVYKLGGVFDKNSGLLIAQQYCINCGSNFHEYKNYKIVIRIVNDEEFDYDSLNINEDMVSDNSYLIIKYKPNELILKYESFPIKDILGKKVSLNNLKDKFEDIVNELFPIKLMK